MNDASRFPSLLGCLGLGPRAVLGALAAPRRLLLVAAVPLACTVAAVLPAYMELAELLNHSPLAGGRFGRLLYDDAERLYPQSRPSLGAAGLVAMLAWTFFAGGVVAGDTRGRLGLGAAGVLLAQSGRFFFRSLRSWLVFVVALVIWSWLSLGLARPLLEGWLEGEGWLALAGDERRLLRFEIAVNLVWFLGFAELWIVRRLALARLVIADRRSALAASFASFGLLLRYPLRTLVAFAMLFVVWAAGLALFAFAVGALEARGYAFAVVAIAIVALLFYQACLMASFVLARRIAEFDAQVRGADLTGAPPANQ